MHVQRDIYCCLIITQINRKRREVKNGAMKSNEDRQSPRAKDFLIEFRCVLKI